LLASGCRACDAWADEALSRFGDRQVAAVVPLAWDAEQPDRLFAAGVGYRQRGLRYRVGQGAAQLAGEVRPSIVGPAAFAGFYRKAALDFVGGLSTQLGRRQADVDLGFVLRRAGFSVVVEPRSRVLATAEADPAEGALSEALYDERLFWRNLDAAGRAAALAAHAGCVALELAASLPRPRFAAQLAGRLWGCLELPRHARHKRALAALSARAVSAKGSSGRMRFDAAHEAAARSETPRKRAHAG
jgi:hypothetical protein